MGNSLQDQLLKANLANKKQAQKAKSQRHQARKGKGDAKADAGSLTQEQRDKVARDRELNRQQQEAVKQKSIVAQVRQLIEANRLSREEGETAYRFVDGKSVKTLYVTESMQTQLASGVLMVSKLGEQYEVIPKGVAEKVAQRDPNAVIAQDRAEAQASVEDEYAGYEVPDDLVW